MPDGACRSAPAFAVAANRDRRVGGVYSAAFVVALGPVLGLPPAARSGLLGGAAVILALTALCWWYVRRDRSVGNDVSL